jgi:hypothetical protein
MVSNWDLVCSLNLRNWSDRYSNWSFAKAARVDAGVVPAIIGDGRLPSDTATLFLHEVTHHLIFDSPVGLALVRVARLRSQNFRVALQECL